MSKLELEANEILFVEGDQGSEMYILKTGKLRVLKREGSQMVKLIDLGPGAVIGEMSLLDNAPRSATVRTLEKSTLVTIDKSLLNSTYAKIPKWLSSMLRILVKRLRDTTTLKHQKDQLHSLPLLLRSLLLMQRNIFPRAIDAASGISTALLEKEMLFQYGIQPKDTNHLLHILSDLGIFTLSTAKRRGEVVLIPDEEILSQYYDFIFHQQKNTLPFVKLLNKKQWGCLEEIIQHGKKLATDSNGYHSINTKMLHQSNDNMDSFLLGETLTLLHKYNYITLKAQILKTEHGSHTHEILKFKDSSLEALQRYNNRLNSFEKDLVEYL